MTFFPFLSSFLWAHSPWCLGQPRSPALRSSDQKEGRGVQTGSLLPHYGVCPSKRNKHIAFLYAYREVPLAGSICPLRVLADFILQSPVFYLVGGRRPWKASWFPVNPSPSQPSHLSLELQGWAGIGSRLCGPGVLPTCTSKCRKNFLSNVNWPGLCSLSLARPVKFYLIKPFACMTDTESQSLKPRCPPAKSITKYNHFLSRNQV